MDFEKYTGIENHYNNKNVNFFMNAFPNFDDMTYQITEKIDGANFQIKIGANEVKFGKRNSFLGDDQGFFDWQRTVKDDKRFEELITQIQAGLLLMKDETGVDDCVTVYGELYGPGVQRRIQYGKQKAIRLFEAKSDVDGWFTPQGFEEMLDMLGLLSLHVPILGYANGLTEALEFNSAISTKLFEQHDGTNIEKAQEMEGIVIKPYHEICIHREKRLIIKKKNDSFNERSGVTPKVRTTYALSTNQVEFQGYINENRLASVVSQHGEPSGNADIGRYISLLGQDAYADFIKDKGWEDSSITKDDKKALMSQVGRIAAPLVKALL
jgi:Rnl2 family RNA ligase